MARPVVGIIGNSYTINDRYPAHAGGTINSAAVAEVAECVPLIIPADPRYASVAELMEVCDGFVLTGGRPNVHPEEYGEEPTEAHGAFDRARDAITLPLVRACVASGQPFLGICRGFQEVNVAMGGTLHPEIREIDGPRQPPHAARCHDGRAVRAAPQRDVPLGRRVSPAHGGSGGDDQHAARAGRDRCRARRGDRRLGA